MFNVIKDVFKDFFTDKKEDNQNNADKKSDNEDLLDLNHRPILKRIIEKDIISSFQLNQNNQRNRERNNNLRHTNSYVYRRPQLFADDILPVSTACWFYSCENLTSIQDIQQLNTANVTGTRGMFYDCWNLTSLDVSGFNTENATAMASIFSPS